MPPTLVVNPYRRQQRPATEQLLRTERRRGYVTAAVTALIWLAVVSAVLAVAFTSIYGPEWAR